MTFRGACAWPQVVAKVNHEKRSSIYLLKVTVNTESFNTTHSNRIPSLNFLSLQGPLVSLALIAQMIKKLANRKERLKVSLRSLGDHSAVYTVSHAPPTDEPIALTGALLLFREVIYFVNIRCLHHHCDKGTSPIGTGS